MHGMCMGCAWDLEGIPGKCHRCGGARQGTGGHMPPEKAAVQALFIRGGGGLLALRPTHPKKKT